MCTVLLPSGVNSIAVRKYIIYTIPLKTGGTLTSSFEKVYLMFFIFVTLGFLSPHLAVTVSVIVNKKTGNVSTT
jgi:hypothetical protein